MTDQSVVTDDDLLAARISDLLSQALSTLVRDDTGARVFPIPEAAARLNMSARTLELMCRQDEVVHTKIGKRRGLTAAQIERVAADHEIKTGSTSVSPHLDDLAEARSASSKAASRRSPRRNG